MGKKKRNPLFSLKTYLLKKAQNKLAKLQFRAERREKKGTSSHNHEHNHVHDHEHDHEHEHEDLFVEVPASELPKLYDELSEVSQKVSE